MNWLVPYPKIELDENISPLAASAYLGRTQIAQMLLENETVEIDL